MKLAFDWDGTLVDHEGRPQYDNPLNLAMFTRPHVAALSRVQRLIKEGHEVHIVTGRGPHVRDVTINQARLFLAPDFPGENLHMQPHFSTYEALRVWKAEVLRAIRPSLYVGDHQCDLGAAYDAKVPFMEAHTFRQGHALAIRMVAA